MGDAYSIESIPPEREKKIKEFGVNKLILSIMLHIPLEKIEAISEDKAEKILDEYINIYNGGNEK